MLRSLALCGLVAIVLTSCGTGDRTQPAASGVAGTTVERTDAAPTPSLESASAPDVLQFEAPVVGGGQLDFRSFAGDTVALWFWAPT
jgi:hypothetical protein